MCIKAFKYELAWAIDKWFQFISNVKMLLRTVTIYCTLFMVKKLHVYHRIHCNRESFLVNFCNNLLKLSGVAGKLKVFSGTKLKT